MTDKTPAGPQEAQGGPQSAQEVSDGELAGRDRDRGVGAASGDSGWTQLEARAFNAVGPAVRDAGQWLPLSARRAVANAVLAVVQPELDRHARLRSRVQAAADEARGSMRDWLVDALSDSADPREPSTARTFREQTAHAEAAIARVAALCSLEQNTDALGHLRRSQDVLAALDQPAPTATDGPSCTCGGRFPIQHLHADQHKPTAHDGGPTVAEAAADDQAHWNQRQWGDEQP